MTTKAFRKRIASLAVCKGRKKYNEFLAEGSKCVEDTLGYFQLHYLIATDSWIENHRNINNIESELIKVSRQEICEMSAMSTPSDVIAVYEIPEQIEFEPKSLDGKLVLALDRIQDPGNLGTIIRTADWMGVDTILASFDTVDCYNPKTVQATMGALSRVNLIYGNLSEMISKIEAPVYGTFLEGENIYKSKLTPNGVVVMGNEGKGVSEEVKKTVNKKLFIPPYPGGRITSESLNVATATAIVMSCFRGRLLGNG